jgi:O-antigen ligase
MYNLIRELKRTLRSITPAERAGVILLLLFVLLAPVPYGAVTPSGVLRIQIFAFVIGAIGLLAGGQRWTPLPILSIGAMAGVAVVGAIQLIPMSPELLAALSPSSAAVYAEANGTLRLSGESPLNLRLSIAPFETARVALLVLSYIFIFVASARLTVYRWQRTAVVSALLIAALGHVLYAAVAHPDEPRMHGTFINPNHFAGYLQIALAFAFAVIWVQVVTAARRTHEEDAGQIVERRVFALTWRALIWAAIAVGIGFSMSRMGIAAQAAATAAMLVLALLHGRGRRLGRQGAIALGVFASAILVVIAATGQTPILRFLASDPRDPQSDLRFHIWQVSGRTWRKFPHFGSGLGSFRDAFRRSQPSELEGMIEQAHNDGLQLLVTGGWISLLLAAVAIGSFAILLARRWWLQKRRHEAAYALAAMGALIALLVHGLAEFNFSIPAIPATLAVMLGVGWSAANARPEH